MLAYRLNPNPPPTYCRHPQAEKPSLYPFISLHVVLGTMALSWLGSMMHFFYQWSDCSAFFAVFCAVNESTYEHAKIMLFPIFFWWSIVALVTGEFDRKMLLAFNYALYSALFLLLIGNYLSIVMHFETITYDITLFVFCIFYGQLMGALVYARWFVSDTTSTCFHASALFFLVVLLFISTYAPPPFAAYLFADPRNGLVGIPVNCTSLPFWQFQS